jgi:hypothetical protein
MDLFVWFEQGAFEWLCWVSLAEAVFDLLQVCGTAIVEVWKQISY